ncbi:tRNA pseudouridine(54/55) synthase Pus10 [Nitrosopumilus sp.]|nr:tRNA pseudouridine(54/55) synthase Pus10 [Nitrosopumilus sp.]
MSNYPTVLSTSNEIIKKYHLCDYCLGRLFTKQLRLSSNKILGKKLKNGRESNHSCYICKNLFDNLDHFLKLMLDSSFDYKFRTFSIGTIIKPSIVDRDDALKSEFRLRGIDGVKSDITKELVKLFSKKTKKIANYIDPDIIFTVNLKEPSCNLRSKPIVISGRYTKSKRGYSQKQKSCDNCSGKGCRTCDFHGISEFNSVEGVISKLIFKKFGGTTTKFTWIGGEDKSSLVLGSGRPFIVKLQNPSKRKIKLSDYASDFISIFNLKIIDDSPKTPLKFSSLATIKISTDSKFDAENLKKLKNLKNNFITVSEKSGRSYEKKIFDINYKKTSDQIILVKIMVEGGLPIKRFVIGNDVTPNISETIGTHCIPEEFDFLQIIVNDNN